MADTESGHNIVAFKYVFMEKRTNLYLTLYIILYIFYEDSSYYVVANSSLIN